MAASGLVVGDLTSLDDPAYARAYAAITARWSFAFCEVAPIWYTLGDDAGTIYVTIDVVDRGDQDRLAFRPVPTHTIADPGGLVAAWRDAEARAQRLLVAGELEVGVCRGGLHCATGFGHDALRALEDRFIADTPRWRGELTTVLRDEADPRVRPAAAFVLAYAGDADAVIAALTPSIADPSPLVRNNLLRVLAAIVEGDATADVPVAQIARALRYPTSSDRNKAVAGLELVARHRPDFVRALVRGEIGETLVAMTALLQPNNRDIAVMLLTTLAGADLGSPSAWLGWLTTTRATAITHAGDPSIA